jgi:parallel beta-helix repeat protein
MELFDLKASCGRRAWLRNGASALARLAVVAAIPPVRFSAGRTWSVQEFGARPDGRTNSTPGIQRALDAAREAGGGTVVLRPGESSYRLDGTLFLRHARNVVITSGAVTAARLEQGATNAMLLRIENASGCSVQGLHLVGRGRAEPDLYATSTYAPALYIASSERVDVRRNTIERATSNGIDGFNSSHCTIEDNECRETALFNGIGWAGGTGNRFIGNRLHHNRGQGIEIRSQSDFVVARNRAWANGDPSFNQSAGITIESENGVVEVESVTPGERTIIRSSRPHRKKTGDSLTVTGARGSVTLNGTHRVTVIDSLTVALDVDSRPSTYEGGASLVLPNDQHLPAFSSNGTVEGNTCAGNNGEGIYIVAANNAVTKDIRLVRNVCSHNTMNGIACATGVSTQDFRDCHSILIDDCTLQSNGKAGVLLYFCDDVSMRRNRIVGNGGAGVNNQASGTQFKDDNCVRGNHPDLLGLRNARSACR